MSPVVTEIREVDDFDAEQVFSQVEGENMPAVVRAFFEHYVFDAGDETVAHIPVDRRGAPGDLDDSLARRIRVELRNKLNR